MVKTNIKDIAKSIRRRLLNHAQTQGENFNTLMVQYILQRLLYRLSVSEYADNFLLKGAWLFVVWNNALHRPTKDIDLLGFGNNDPNELLLVFKSIVRVAIEEPDGVVFTIDTFKSALIKEGEHYQGVRITGQAKLDTAKVPVQIDIGFGDAVTPDASEACLPSLLGMPEAQLRVYPVYTVIAEKFQAMVMLGIANSRMKDFYDIKTIASTMQLDGQILFDAIRATFERRKTDIKSEALYVFSDEFKQDKGKQTQWAAFLNKNSLETETNFSDVVYEIQQFLEPVYRAIAGQHDYKKPWLADKFQWKDE